MRSLDLSGSSDVEVAAAAWTHSPCCCVAFAPDGRLATADADGISIWQAGGGAVRRCRIDTASTVFDLVFEPRASKPRLFAASADGAIHVWADDVEVAKLHASNSAMRALAISADGTTLVSGDDRGELQFWNAPASIRLDDE